MEREYVVEKLISALPRLSDQELRALSDLFSYGDVAYIFRVVVEQLIQMRNIERERYRDAVHAEERPPGRRSRPKRLDASEPAEARFIALLNDRTLFPSTRDVVDVLNDIFGLGFRYEDHQKQGRRDLIQKGWNHLQRMPVNERRRVLRVLSQRDQSRVGASEGYRELFRILSQK